MILISHRGNTEGKTSQENHPDYIMKAYNWGYDVEIDVWFIDNKYYLGHDEPIYETNLDFVKNRHFWVHCKNLDALYNLSNYKKDINYFWHQDDEYTLTSWGVIWTFPGKILTNYSVAVLPELYTNTKLDKCYGICSDYIKRY